MHTPPSTEATNFRLYCMHSVFCHFYNCLVARVTQIVVCASIVATACSRTNVILYACECMGINAMSTTYLFICNKEKLNEVSFGFSLFQMKR